MDLSGLPLPLNLAIFIAAAIVVWIAGTRLSAYADIISTKTGIGQALVGLFLLAGVTSLPEIAVSTTAAATGDAELAVNNLFGSIAMQVAVLAIIDFVIGRQALTSVAPDPGLLLLGTLNVLLLAIAAAGIVVGDVLFLGVGLWAWASLAAYIFCLWLLSQGSDRRPWLPAELVHADQEMAQDDGTETVDSDVAEGSVPMHVSVKTVVAAATILVAGFAVSQTGGAIADQTGLGSSFVGFVLVAISTSLPELSTALGAARRGRFTMAISDILGTNLINIGLLFLVDAVARGDAVLNVVGSFSVFGAILGIIVTTLFLAGLAERRDRTVFRFGVDSAAVLVVYAGGLALLYTLR